MFEPVRAVPRLVEGGVKECVHRALSQCHAFKDRYYSTLQSIAFFIAFCLFFGGILYARYRGRPSEEELKKRELETQKYIMTKIREYQDARLRLSQQLVTGLPHWDAPFVKDVPQ